jgi:hypothetical protein
MKCTAGILAGCGEVRPALAFVSSRRQDAIRNSRQDACGTFLR